jgi:hypothetical protein
MATATMMSRAGLRAFAPTRQSRVIAGPDLPGTVLGTFPTAIYIRVPAAFGVIALLTRDAVRVPCGVQLPSSSREFPLDRLTGPVRVGGGALRIGTAEITVRRLVSVSVPRLPAPRRVDSDIDVDVDVDVADPARLLGLGSGLTPSGDDVLAGYLAGAAAYGLPVDELRTFVCAEAPLRTTTLSAALLRHAASGEAIPQVCRLLLALDDGAGIDVALAGLLRVGHTSGAALAAGVLAAARAASASRAAAA